MRASFITVATAFLALTEIAAAQAPAGAHPHAKPKTAVPAAAPAPSAAPASSAAPAQGAAAAPAAEPTPAQRDAAREAYTRGQALFAQSKYEEAEAAFQQAYAAVANPVVLLSLAECSVRLGKLDEAETLMQRYLSSRPDAPDRAEIEQKIAELRATPSTLALNTQPPGASVKLDGVDTGKVTPVELTVTPGSHRVDVALEGRMPLSETVEIKIGGRHELQIALQPAPVAPPPEPVVKAPPPPPPPAPRDTDPTAALWVTSIVGAAGLVTGTVLGFMVLAERSDYDASPSEEIADRGERLALFADVAFGVGAMALITGAVLYLTDDSDEPEPTTKPTARLQLRGPGTLARPALRSAPQLSVMPLAGPQGAGITARVRY